jgi:4-oxalocrotonate tautomerase
MPIVTVHMWPGRSAEVKSKMIKAITQALSDSAGISPDATQVVLLEVPKDSWGRGGVPASERDAAPVSPKA